ncbi:hypothetical protein [Streptomyces sp. NPDC059247]|uniref:hypothetical protein n=1 Tax=Streptomyces sp. NPDC059247 TaxID=3346790 RepID=UPI0036B481C0
MSAVATLLAALFFCLGAGPGAERHHGTPAERASRAATAPATAPAGAFAAAEYVCPYDRGGCSLFPSLSPAVLSAPPLDPPPYAADGPPRPAPSVDGGRAVRTAARARAPDLHVLQVLRT